MESARVADQQDRDRLVELGGEALAELSAQRGGPQLVRGVLNGKGVAGWVDAALSMPGWRVVAGELGGVVMGFGAARLGVGSTDVTAASVEALYVEQGARGVGLGEAMMDDLAAWAGEQGCSGIDAVALPGNRPAKAFFEAHGLVARALIMHRPLSR